MASLDDVREYLAAPRCAVLSTLDSSGAPHQAVVHYDIEQEVITLNGDATRLWVRHLRRDPRVAIAVHDEADSLHWVGIKGTARLRHEDDRATDDAMELAKRYGDDPAAYAGRERVTLEVVPDRVYEYGR